MNGFLDTLKIRMTDSQRRLHEATQRLQAAQAEHQAAAQEAASWQNAVQAEARREAYAAALAQAKSGQVTPTLPTAATAVPVAAPVTAPAQAPSPPSAEPDLNKSELIRQVLRDNPGGLTPVEVWRKLNNQITNRNYVYSVLGRLKDREQVTVKRGKYAYRVIPKGEDTKDITVQ